ncbi:hypothetical protein GCM10008904_32430 [Paraclostridium ghonii]|uniref:DNA-binding Lrp family transcriptional regulator n=1 Tax=Paraclostridium ghonii TaxID=29358 RepID=A0ABU0MWS3_9FIRM|nr:YjcQ family protein [Paeniclostridium ghonii]MDQ0555352.1 DNA-binding Lrp family transcriptional regulator [Paeniclostridium ghonii]
MKLDTKQKVLVAIYTEYQKDIPDMEEEITSEKLGIERSVFIWALDKLVNEEYITEYKKYFKEGEYQEYSLYGMKITRAGIDYVETKLGIDKTLSGMEKVQELTKKSVNWGWNEFKDIIIKVGSEMGKHGMDKVIGN